MQVEAFRKASTLFPNLVVGTAMATDGVEEEMDMSGQEEDDEAGFEGASFMEHEKEDEWMDWVDWAKIAG